jgi:hypothetical protein
MNDVTNIVQLVTGRLPISDVISSITGPSCAALNPRGIDGKPQGALTSLAGRELTRSFPTLNQ